LREHALNTLGKVFGKEVLNATGAPEKVPGVRGGGKNISFIGGKISPWRKGGRAKGELRRGEIHSGPFQKDLHKGKKLEEGGKVGKRREGEKRGERNVRLQ